MLRGKGKEDFIRELECVVENASSLFARLVTLMVGGC
jgi:hypothetical protein